ncbi:hypothetical protein C8R46DRAFT_1093129 [Mycena filopes]|nr:hypothetical protein C8R46DRAFT_1093129 [Mycena filopes]
MSAPDLWMNGLPTEILIKIFLLARGSPDTPLLESRNPWLLGQICSRWRSIAVCMPHLWSSIMLFSNPHFGLQFVRIQPILDSVRSLIARSGQLPLKLSLDARWSAEDRRALLDLLLPESDRWQDIHIHYLTSGPRRRMLTMLLQPNTFAALKTLRFSASRGPWESIHILLPNLTALLLTGGSTDLLARFTLPRLEHLHLERFLDYMNFNPIDITAFLHRSACPLARLTLRETPMKDVDIVALLTLLPSLVKLEIDHSRLTTPSRALSNILLASLRSLGIVPKLRRLSLGSLSHLSPDLVLDVLESRSWDNDEMRCVALRSVQLHYHQRKEFGVETMERVRALYEGGMSVKIRMDESWMMLEP